MDIVRYVLFVSQVFIKLLAKFKHGGNHFGQIDRFLFCKQFIAIGSGKKKQGIGNLNEFLHLFEQFEGAELFFAFILGLA